MPSRVIAIDRSGAAERAATRVWLAEVIAGRLVRDKCGYGRETFAEHVIEEAVRWPELTIELDFAYLTPA